MLTSNIRILFHNSVSSDMNTSNTGLGNSKYYHFQSSI